MLQYKNLSFKAIAKRFWRNYRDIVIPAIPALLIVGLATLGYIDRRRTQNLDKLLEQTAPIPAQEQRIGDADAFYFDEERETNSATKNLVRGKDGTYSSPIAYTNAPTSTYSNSPGRTYSNTFTK